jgi:hypothetical protein
MPFMKKIILISILVFPFNLLLQAQENYEIQVYSSPTMTKGKTIFELHSNFTFDGHNQPTDAIVPTQHSLHETLEITHGLFENFELGFYVFTDYTPGHGYKFVGSHIRPRYTAPQKWKLPFGLSISAELGTQKKQYSADQWSLELRPIIDKQWKKCYLSVNPVLGVQLKSATKQSAPAFSPNVKFSYTATSKISPGIEYYGDMGTLKHFESLSNQTHAVFAVLDLYVDPKWEFNFGPGFGLTNSAERFVFKSYIGRRINWKRNVAAINTKSTTVNL